MQLSGRDRVLMALNHEKPDRVPADIWAEPAVWNRLMKDLGKENQEEVRELLSIDVRYLEPDYPPDVIQDGVRQNMWGERWRMTETAFGTDWEHVEGALVGAQSLDELEAFSWPTCDMVDYSHLRAQCEKWRDFAIFFGNADFFERPALLRSLEIFLIDTLDHPDWVAFIQQKFIDFFIEDFARAMDASNGKIDVYWALTDLGSQDRLLLSMESMQTFIFPALTVLADLVHREGVKILFHSCGSIRSVIPDLIDTGIDILNPLQPRAAGMDPAELKDEFGRRLAFHGGIDIQYLLPLETPETVKAEVQKRIGILGMDGGYILAPSHNLQNDTPTSNIIAMYDVDLRSF